MYPIYAGWLLGGLTAWLALLPLGESIRAIGGENAEKPVLRQQATTAATTYPLTQADERLLEEIQHGCFLYLWNEVGSPGKLVKDRMKADICSTAAVGFQLSSLPIGVERGWISREEGTRRAMTVLKTLMERTDNKKFGLYLHFVNADTGAIVPEWGQNQVSTVDHALLLAGALPAAVYFGDEIAEQVDRMAAQSNWKAFDVSKRGFISFGWRPENNGDLSGPGEMRPWDWHDAADEERLVYFMAVGCPSPEFAGDPRDYYRLDRNIRRHADMPPYVVSWNGLLFTYFFSHCWIDYRSLEADDPAQFDIDAPRVDWFENSRRAVLTHRSRCAEMASKYATLGPNRWGLSPCSGLNEKGEDSYLVPDIRPNLSTNDNWSHGTIAPYAAGSAIMFAPEESIAALREFRTLNGKDGKLLAWRDPASGGYGLVDSFNLDQQHSSEDYIGIDVGPMLLAIENVRTGLIWNLFMQHDVAKRAVRRLRFSPIDAAHALKE
jgi:hypothetical protein